MHTKALVGHNNFWVYNNKCWDTYTHTVKWDLHISFMNLVHVQTQVQIHSCIIYNMMHKYMHTHAIQ
jgi:hypothetical protein